MHSQVCLSEGELPARPAAKMSLPTPKRTTKVGGRGRVKATSQTSRGEAIGDGRRLVRAPSHAKELAAVRPDGNVRGAVFATLCEAVRSTAVKIDSAVDYARGLERVLYVAHRHHRVGYVRSARRLLFNLQVNGLRLLQDYPNPATLAAVGDRELARGTPAEQSILQGEERERKLREIIAGRGGLEQSNRSLLRCHRTPACRNARVEWDEVQSRAADEAATITATCLACGARWKLY